VRVRSSFTTEFVNSQSMASSRTSLDSTLWGTSPLGVSQSAVSAAAAEAGGGGRGSGGVLPLHCGLQEGIF
jgi:hypothetical protein